MSNPVGLPDLLGRLRSTRSHAELKTRLDQATRELASGERRDRFAATGGDTGRLLSLDRAIARAGDRQSLLGLATGRAAATGAALDGVRDLVSGLGAETMNAVARNTNREVTLGALSGVLSDVLGRLNTESGGRFLFSGAATDVTPFADPAAPSGFRDRLLAGLSAAPPADLDALTTAVDAFFEEEWGALYRGEGAGASVELEGGRRLDYGVTLDPGADPTQPPEGDAPALRALVRDLALSAWAEDLAATTGGAVETDAVLDAGARRLLDAEKPLVDLRARLGAREARLEAASVAATAEKTTLETRRNDMIGADPYETATRLLELETRLEQFYAVTARAARLNFADYMR